jgi:acyl-coenzyme A thioesterase PaaI-like protein
MDVTALASSLLEPIPAHRALGLEVEWAGDCRGRVSLQTPSEMTNVIGSLHSSGLVALIDAAGLAAIIGACEAEHEFEGVLPLGAAASLRFHRPAGGRLLATCVLDSETQQSLRPVLSQDKDRARVTTSVDITDETGALVCQGTFDWSVRRVPSSSRPAVIPREQTDGRVPHGREPCHGPAGVTER